MRRPLIVNEPNKFAIQLIDFATATRDLQNLLEKGAIIPFGEGGGRSTKYQLNL